MILTDAFVARFFVGECLCARCDRHDLVGMTAKISYGKRQVASKPSSYVRLIRYAGRHRLLWRAKSRLRHRQVAVVVHSHCVNRTPDGRVVRRSENRRICTWMRGAAIRQRTRRRIRQAVDYVGEKWIFQRWKEAAARSVSLKRLLESHTTLIEEYPEPIDCGGLHTSSVR